MENMNGKRFIKSKTTGELFLQYAHLIHGQYMFLPVNFENFEIVEA